MLDRPDNSIPIVTTQAAVNVWTFRILLYIDVKLPTEKIESPYKTAQRAVPVVEQTDVFDDKHEVFRDLSAVSFIQDIA